MLIPPSPPRDAADDADAAATTAAMMMMMMIMTMIRLIPLDVRRVESEGPGRGGRRGASLHQCLVPLEVLVVEAVPARALLPASLVLPEAFAVLL